MRYDKTKDELCWRYKMAENELKTQLDEMVKNQTAGDDKFWETLANSGTALDGFSARDLENIMTLVPENSKFREAIINKANERLATLNTTDELKFIDESSYSRYNEFKELLAEAKTPNNNISAESSKRLSDLLVKANIIVGEAQAEELTPEKAVVLKDNISIVREADVLKEEDKAKLAAFEAKVDEQLKVFDQENGLDKLEGVSAEELKQREDFLHEMADKYYGKENITEEVEVIKNLVIQEMKLKEIAPDDKLLEEISQKLNKDKEEVARIFKDGLSGKELGDNKDVYDEILEQVEIAKTKEFEQKCQDYSEQFKTAESMELAKLTVEELYPENLGMSTGEIIALHQKREAELDKMLAEGKLPDKEEWIEENVLRRLRKKYPKEEQLSDEDFAKKYGEEFVKYTLDYKRVADEITQGVRTSFALKTDLLANRSSRIVNAPDINPKTKSFLQDFAQKNPIAYTSGKLALTVGKSMAISSAVKLAFGFKGMAAYSAYNTNKAIKKSWNKYKEQNGGKGNFVGFLGYLKDNKNERTTIVSGIAKTTIMSTLAVAGTALGFDNVPGVSAALVGAVNTVATAVRIKDNKEQIKKTFKDVYNKVKNSPKLKKWGLVGLVGAGAVTAAYFMMSDETKEKISESLGDLFKKDDSNDGMTDFDKKLVAESDGQTMTPEERERILNFKPQEGSVLPNLDEAQNNGAGLENNGAEVGNTAQAENAAETNATEANAAQTGNAAEANATEGNAAQAAADVPALSESDIKLLVTDCKMGPDPIVHKLEEMGVLSAEDKEQLIASGGRKGGVASRVLAAYLGHPYDGTEVPVHATLSAEQQQELNSFLHSQEYQQECDKCNMSSNANRLAKLREHIRASGENSGADNANGDNLTEVTQGNENQNPVPEQKTTTVAIEEKKKFLGLTTKTSAPQDFEVSEQDKEYQTVRKVVIDRHLQTGVTHMNVKPQNGPEYIATIRGDENQMSLTIKSGDFKERLTIDESGAAIARYRGNVGEDVDLDGKADKMIGRAQDGNGNRLTAYETADGKKIVVQSQVQPDGSEKDIGSREVKNPQNLLKQFYKNAKENGK